MKGPREAQAEMEVSLGCASPESPGNPRGRPVNKAPGVLSYT